MKTLSRLCLLWGSILASIMISSPSALANRPTYGASAYPIWSPLSFFERQTISDYRSAKDDDPAMLLSLYLVASGEQELKTYQAISEQISQFQERLDKHLTSSRDPWLAGKLINQFMHNDFFLEPTTEQKTGYSVDQSRLMGIFETGEFNCISSALLYAVLARHSGLNASGVLLPSHAFIQLNLADGRRVEVETTSPSGYDQVHDEQFYQAGNQDWFSSRGLEPTSYKDYLKREFVSLRTLGARNMLNQHTAQSEMHEDDSFRLAEISAYLDPNYPLAQEKRLYFYNTEIHQLIGEKDWESLTRLFDTTFDTVIADAQRHAGNPKIQKALQMYLSGALLSFAQMGQVENTLDVMGQLLTYDWQQAESEAELRQRIVSAISLLLDELVKRQQFDEALLVISLTEVHLSEHPAWSDMRAWLYMRWAEDFWQQRDWEGVIFTLKDFQNVAPRTGDKHPKELMASAYYNWILELTDTKDFATASGVLEQCAIQATDRQVCRKARQLLSDRSPK